VRVLFVGNSYTFYNAMPEQVVALAKEAGLALHQEQVVEGGANVELHWKDTGARQRIEQGGFSHVVLQDQSGGPLHDRHRFERFMPRLISAAQDSGATVLLYQTWARARGHEAYGHGWTGGSRAAMTQRVRDAYRNMAQQCGATVAPVGDAWQLALEHDPALILHDTDLHHASPLGSHLAALVFYSVLCDRDPRVMAWTPENVDEDAASKLRQAAAEATRLGATRAGTS